MAKRSKGKRGKNKQGAAVKRPAVAAAAPSPSQDDASSAPQRIAVFGGDGRHDPLSPLAGKVRYFASPGDGGNGDTRRLETAIRAGGVDLVIIVTRWQSHGAANHIYRLCRQLGVRVERASCAP